MVAREGELIRPAQPRDDEGAALLRIEGLSVSFPGRRGADTGERNVVRGLDLELHRGELLGVVGESGCGKTMAALSVMGLLPPPGRVTAGRVLLAGEELTSLSEGEMRRRRGSRVAMVFQEPMSALNPVFTVGFQVAEAVRAHRDLSRAEAKSEAVELLRRVSLPDPGRRARAYPHELSGGQRQRVMIAIALAGGPEVLLADEPTTALDVTVQAEILELLDGLRRDLGLAVLLITHDLAVVGQTCDRVVVMYAGQAVEEAPAAALFEAPAHPYSQALLASLPRLGRPVPRGELPVIAGRVPEPGGLPPGCAFHPRCPQVMEVCPQRPPETYDPGTGRAEGPAPRVRWARCFLHAPGLSAAERSPLVAAPAGPATAADSTDTAAPDEPR